MSRHHVDVATWATVQEVATSFEVATWLVKSGRGMDVATSFEVATWGRLVQCSALFCALFRSLFGLLFGHCSGTLFMNTVHRKKIHNF